MVDLKNLAIATSKDSFLPEFIINTGIISDVNAALPKMYSNAPNIEYSFYRALDSKILSADQLPQEDVAFVKNHPDTVLSSVIEAYDFCVIQTCFGDERTTLDHKRVTRDYLFFLQTRIMQSITIPVLSPWFYMENILRTKFNPKVELDIVYEPVRNEYLEFMTFENFRAQLKGMSADTFKTTLVEILNKLYHFDTNFEDLIMWLELPTDFNIIDPAVEHFAKRVFSDDPVL
ncbi:MAG: hypothetical protein BEN18_07960 [Epulopiscium sp. Nuni2H_MBin001]|nr:MAG: hypothetical protein BEN18_07960 [Epulopiscium sp. Nuni2H_MBin001]